MSLKTASVPTSKKKGVKSADKADDDNTSCLQATQTKTTLNKKTKNQRGNIGSALLRAYDNSGNMDRSHRITVSWLEQVMSLLLLIFFFCYSCQKQVFVWVSSVKGWRADKVELVNRSSIVSKSPGG